MTRCKLSSNAPWPSIELTKDYIIYKNMYVPYIENTPGIKAIKQHLEFEEIEEPKKEKVRKQKSKGDIPPLPKE